MPKYCTRGVALFQRQGCPPTATTTACPRSQSPIQSFQREQLLPFLLPPSFMPFHQSFPAPCIAVGFSLVDSGNCCFSSPFLLLHAWLTGFTGSSLHLSLGLIRLVLALNQMHSCLGQSQWRVCQIPNLAFGIGSLYCDRLWNIAKAK